MTTWHSFETNLNTISPFWLYENHIAPHVAKNMKIEAFSITGDAMYILAHEPEDYLFKRILIAQYQLYGQYRGFRILEEHNQPLNFHCPKELLIQSTNRHALAEEWRKAQHNPSLQRELTLSINQESLHLADDFMTVKKWRKQLRYGMVIESKIYGKVTFDRPCSQLIQFMYVLDHKKNEIYCHFNEFSIAEINTALNKWTSRNLKPSIGF